MGTGTSPRRAWHRNLRMSTGRACKRAARRGRRAHGSSPATGRWAECREPRNHRRWHQRRTPCPWRTSWERTRCPGCRATGRGGTPASPRCGDSAPLLCLFCSPFVSLSACQLVSLSACQLVSAGRGSCRERQPESYGSDLARLPIRTLIHTHPRVVDPGPPHPRCRLSPKLLDIAPNDGADCRRGLPVHPQVPGGGALEDGQGLEVLWTERSDR